MHRSRSSWTGRRWSRLPGSTSGMRRSRRASGSRPDARSTGSGGGDGRCNLRGDLAEAPEVPGARRGASGRRRAPGARPGLDAGGGAPARPRGRARDRPARRGDDGGDVRHAGQPQGGGRRGRRGRVGGGAVTVTTKAPAGRTLDDRIAAVLPVLHEESREGDDTAEVPVRGLAALRESGLVGLVVPGRAGGGGGGG